MQYKQPDLIQKSYDPAQWTVWFPITLFAIASIIGGVTFNFCLVAYKKWPNDFTHTLYMMRSTIGLGLSGLVIISILPQILNKRYAIQFKGIGLRFRQFQFSPWHAIGIGIISKLPLSIIVLTLFPESVHPLDPREFWTKPEVVAIFVLLSGIIISIYEEILFRGLLYNALRKHLHFYIAITLTTIAHAAIHGWNFSTISAIELGIITGYIYEKYRSLTACCIIHMTRNITGLIFWSFFR